MSKYSIDDLRQMQAWPLERKIQVTQTRIREGNLVGLRCIYCINAIADPEVGYTCRLELWNSFEKHFCIRFKPDYRFIIDKARKERHK